MKGYWIFLVVSLTIHFGEGCQFYPPGEYLRFVRIPENLKVGDEILSMNVYPRNNLVLQSVDKAEDVQYFKIRDFNRTTVSLVLAKSLEDLVDSDTPRNVLKFKVSCDYNDGEDTITTSLSITVYVEDLNDHDPVFVGTPYDFFVDELTPIGVTIHRGIRAIDRDKPNTPNSDVQYAIIAGNERGKFNLESTHQAHIVLRKPLDFDSGDKEFNLVVLATDRGYPPRSANTTVRVHVNDNDDLTPKFTKGVYRTSINEHYPITGARIHQQLHFSPLIYAYDQDLAINTPIRYDIIAGNERHLFWLDHVNGSLFLEKEIDLDAERSLPGNTFVLQIQAAQVDNPFKTGVARVEVEIIDVNDNLPEFEVDFYNISIVENLPNGFSVLQIVATDQDQGDNSEFSYQLEDKSGAFTINSRTGWLTVRDQTVLDREKRPTISMQVYAKEKAPSAITSKIGSSSVAVEVTLLDANDNNPTFIPNNLYNYVVTSSAKRGKVVGQVHAIDPDLGRNGLVFYTLQKAGNSSDAFRVDPRNGQISVVTNNLTVGRHLVFVEASDQPSNPSERRTSLAVVTFEVKHGGGGDKPYPEFLGAPYEFWVGANVDIGTSIGQIRVSDGPEKSRIMYDLLHSYHEGVPFAVEEKSGTITVVDNLGQYKRQKYDFEAVVTNEKDITLVTNVTLHVVDPQDNNIILMKTGTTPIEFHVKENQPNVLIGKLGFKNNVTTGLKFSIANEKDVTDVISITTDGTLHTQRSLDRETRDTYRLTVIAEYNKGAVIGTGIYQVTVIVDDENDNKPVFERTSYEGKIRENSKVGSEVDLNFPVHVSDKDAGSNGQFSVSIFGNGSEIFRLDRNSGRIQFVGADSPIDRERQAVYNLRLVAKDTGGLHSEAKLVITVEDENDNAPIFSKIVVYEDKGATVGNNSLDKKRLGNFDQLIESGGGTFVLSQTYLKAKKPKQKLSPYIILLEDTSVGTPVIKLIAEDKDTDNNSMITYEMVSETYIPNEHSSDSFHLLQYFVIHPATGEISVARSLPPESEFRLNISAIDKGELKDFITMRISVKDVNNHPPVFKKSWYNFDAEEASYSRKSLGKVEATDSDFGPNANISYALDGSSGNLPFTIGLYSGVLTVHGTLDREMKDKYIFSVIARDNPERGAALSSTVMVEVNVLDVNDNAPMFYGYDEIVQNTEGNVYNNHHYQERIPIYYATIAENSPIGTPITRVFANDSDFSGNGNGLILFNIPYKKNRQNLFAVDSKEGIVTNIGKLDYEAQSQHNVSIIASDLGVPSLSSTALLMVNIIDVPEDNTKSSEKPIFTHRYYEVEVEENVPVPLKLLTLNVTEHYRTRNLKFSILGEKNSTIRKMFRIDPTNGSLYIIESPDREQRAVYELIIRLDKFKVGRDMTVMVYPVTNERLGNLGLNEVKVIVRVTDINDNPPRFKAPGRPIVTAIPSNANYNYPVIRLQAHDPDAGSNGDIRYQILSRADEAAKRFSIDPVSGQVRAIASFIKDAGKVFGFDVKATDRGGGDDGRSSIANVFVYVLDEHEQLVMVVGLKPNDVEKRMEDITTALHNITGFDVRIRKLEPHSDRNHLDNSATDMYLYAIDPHLNTVVDMDHFRKVLNLKKIEIERKLKGPKVLFLSSGPTEKSHSKNPRVLLSSLEVGVVVLGCLVFFGTLATAICVLCVRRRKKRLLQKAFTQPLSYKLAGIKGPPPILSAACDISSMVDVPYPPPTMYPHISRHDITCPRYRRQSYGVRSRSSGPLDKSIGSLNSSGQDSGIADQLHCQCGYSSSSEESSDSYEDSLQSDRERRSGEGRRVRDPTPGTPEASNRASNGGWSQPRHSRHRSIAEEALDDHRVAQMSQFQTGAASVRSGHFSASMRKSSTERLMMMN